LNNITPLCVYTHVCACSCVWGGVHMCGETHTCVYVCVCTCVLGHVCGGHMSGQVERGCTSRTLCIRQNSPSTTSLHHVYTHTLNPQHCVYMYVCMHVYGCVHVRVCACVYAHTSGQLKKRSSPRNQATHLKQHHPTMYTCISMYVFCVYCVRARPRAYVCVCVLSLSLSLSA
jgi:hypothetical protein